MPRKTFLALTTAAVAFAGPAAASAAPSATADAQAPGGLGMQLDVKDGAGTMSGQVKTPAGDVIDVSGPVNCVDVKGNSVGLFVKMDKVKPELMGAAIKGMSITLQTDGQGGAKMMGFVPSTVASAPSCEPTVAYLPATGSASVTP